MQWIDANADRWLVKLFFEDLNRPRTQLYMSKKDSIIASVSIQCEEPTNFGDRFPTDQICALGFEKSDLRLGGISYTINESPLPFEETLDLCLDVLDLLRPAINSDPTIFIEIRLGVSIHRGMAAYGITAEAARRMADANAFLALDYYVMVEDEE